MALGGHRPGAAGFMTRSGTRRWGTWAPDECRNSSQRAFATWTAAEGPKNAGFLWKNWGKIVISIGLSMEKLGKNGDFERFLWKNREKR